LDLGSNNLNARSLQAVRGFMPREGVVGPCEDCMSDDDTEGKEGDDAVLEARAELDAALFHAAQDMDKTALEASSSSKSPSVCVLPSLPHRDALPPKQTPQLNTPAAAAGAAAGPHLLIDTDGGVDDALALMAALSARRRGACTIDSITTVHGNVTAAQAADNVERVLWAHHAASVDSFEHICVAVGAEAALVGIGPIPGRWPGHGSDGLGAATLPAMLPAARRRAPAGVHAAVHIVNRCRQRPGELTLVALGPLTNLALALRLEPKLPQLVRRVVVMGGTTEARGNASAVAEYNVLCDAEAAHIVLGAFSAAKLTLVGWEVVLASGFSWEQYDSLVSGAGPMCRLTRDLFSVYEKMVRKSQTGGTVEAQPVQAEAFCPADAFAMAVALRGEGGSVAQVVRREAAVCVGVELSGRCRGLTVCDWTGRFSEGKAPNATVVLDLHRDACRAFLVEALQ